MNGKLEPPPGCDLNPAAKQIAQLNGVSVSTACRWKKEAGVPMRRGCHGVQRASLARWGKLSRTDWEKGSTHVGRLMGVSRQSANQMRQRLIKSGFDVPMMVRQ